MEAERWRQVEALYDAASRLTAAERTSFLDDSCGGDRELRAEVESLLTYDVPAAAFIERPALDVAARLMAAEWPAAAHSLTGTTVAHFQVMRTLGEGGMGVVYEALDTRLGRTVALKFLPPWAVSNPQARARFEREARAASALNHPNICTIYSVQDHGGVPFIEMERLEGATVRERLTRQPFAIAEVVTLAIQIADALEAAHGRGIVHRDLKPANIFCTERGAAKILDFGVATLASAPDATPGAVIGTAGYMSPEQAAGKAVDARSDLFSLGAVLYELATGRAAFQGTSAAAIRDAVVAADPSPPRRVNPAVPAALERVILKALDKDPDRRYQRAADLRADLERLRHQPARRQQTLTTAAVVVLIVAVAAGYWYSPLGPGDLFSANFRTRPVTHNASEFSVGSGAISADGRYVAYTDSRGVHLQSMESGETRRLADGPGAGRWDVAPGWLPDGTAFVANLAASGETAGSSVWLFGISGPPRKLRDAARAVSVSPDGAWIAFASDGTDLGDRDSWVMDRDGTHVRKLFDAGAAAAIAGLSWSPDARRVAYLRIDGDHRAAAIETRDASGGEPATIFRAGDTDTLQGLAWLRDGRLLYSLRRPLTGTSAGTVPCSYFQLRLDAAGRVAGAAWPLAGWLPECVASASFTADGRRALYLQWAIQDAIHVADLDADGLRIASSARLTTTEGRNIPSGWTSDNRAVVFVSDGGGRVALYRQPADADTPQPIAGDEGILGAARLTPDGAGVLYLVQGGSLSPRGAARLRLVPIGGGPSRDVVSGTFVDGGARCAVLPARACAIAERSRDGRALVFSSVDPAGGRGRELARVAAAAGADYRWTLSPDGGRIAVLDARHARIDVLSLAGEAPRAVDVHGSTSLGYVSWTSDGRGLLVPRVDTRGAALLSVDLDGNARVLWQQPGAIDISGIPSPDGRHIAIWVRSRKANLWLAESR
jgi:serine/threonine protein kinase/Tol biopolymer transport system component